MQVNESARMRNIGSNYTSRRSSIRYRPSDRVLKKPAAQGLRSLRRMPKTDNGQILRTFEVRLASTSPPQPTGSTVTFREPDENRRKTQSPLRRQRMFNSRSLPTINTETAHELDNDDDYTRVKQFKGGFTEASGRLPPFQQSKRWPGRQRDLVKSSRTPERLMEKASNSSVSRLQKTSTTGQMSESPNQHTNVESTTFPAASDAASLAFDDPLCGLPTISVLSDLRHRQSMKAHIAVKRWLTKSVTIGSIEPVSSETAVETQKPEKRASLPRRMHSKLLSHRQKIGGSKKLHPGSTEVTSQETPYRLSEVEEISKKSPPDGQSKRLSQSLIPNGDTCEFELEMSREYPRIKEKHFGDAGPAIPKNMLSLREAFGNNDRQGPASQDVSPGTKSPKTTSNAKLDKSTAKNVTATERGSPRQRHKQTSLNMVEEQSPFPKPPLSPPPRTSSRVATDDEAVPSLPIFESQSGPGGLQKSNLDNLSSLNRSLRRKSGGFNLRSRETSVVSRSPSPSRLRSTGSTDTLTNIEAQAGGRRQMSSLEKFSTMAHSLLARPSHPLGNPPERPLPELPTIPQADRQEMETCLSSRSQPWSSRVILGHPILSTSRSSDDIMTVRKSNALPLTSDNGRSSIRTRDVARIRNLTYNSIALESDTEPTEPDLLSSSSTYGQGLTTAISIAKRACSANIDHGEQVRALKRRDVIHGHVPPYYYRISEEDEGDSTDPAEKFPPVPGSRASSRSRSRCHARQRSQSHSIRNRERKGSSAARRAQATAQTLSRSGIMVLVDSKPVTVELPTGAVTSSSLGGLSVESNLSEQRIEMVIQKKSSKRSIRSPPQSHSHSATAINSVYPAPVLPNPHTPPSSASSDTTVDEYNETNRAYEGEGVSPTVVKARAVQIPPGLSTSMFAPVPGIPASARRDAVSERNCNDWDPTRLDSLPRLAQYCHGPDASSISFPTYDALRWQNLKTIKSELDAVRDYIGDLELARARDRRDLSTLRRRNAELERILTLREQMKYQQATRGDRLLESEYARQGRTSLLGPPLLPQLRRFESMPSRSEAIGEYDEDHQEHKPRPASDPSGPSGTDPRQMEAQPSHRAISHIPSSSASDAGRVEIDLDVDTRRMDDLLFSMQQQQ